ncbi:unnamed protein product [Sphenostylis stenocarpa]|uniref:Disease resistance protein At4g27190-like leucine-rich repeats domain-containing protein n=1 Tax=Sphenostylis stenocarpa TaxID=92480 RepID=A0AA86SHJ9_9FABA|nr:unnamed protein product [Sphenostylis stenocarpa]
MHHLQLVHIKGCDDLTSVFPALVAKDVVKLDELVVKECEGLMTTVAENNNTHGELTLPCPCYIKELNIILFLSVDFFFVAYTQLALPGTGSKWSGYDLAWRISEKPLTQLETSYSLLLEYEILQHVPNIEKLVVCDGSFKEIFFGSPSNVDYSGLLTQFKVLHLESLRELVSVGLNLVASNLTHLKVKSCHKLSYLFTSSTAKSLGQLKRMEIIRCESIEEIVSKEAEESEEDEITFPQLSYLILQSLWDMRRFYEGNLSFPALEELSVRYCNRLITLCAGTVKAEKLSRVKFKDVDDDGELSKGIPLETDVNSTMRKEFTREAAYLEWRLEFIDRADLQEIWIVALQIPDLRFTYLKTLIVDGCRFLSHVLPFSLLPLLPVLETLEVRNCDDVKTIFDVKCITQDTEMASMGPTLRLSLKYLILSRLSKLENVWNEDPDGILSMHHLQQIHIEGCDGLTSVFPASVAKDVVKLDELVVNDCKGLMTIVAEDNNTDPSGTKGELTFSCPCVRSLELRGLPNFKCFYYCSRQCDIFTNLESYTENQIRTEKCLSVGANGVDMILHPEFQRILLDNLKVLTLCCWIESDVFPYEILQLVPNIEKLVVCDGSFKEIFCGSGNKVNYSRLLLHLKVLHLESLGDLVSIGLNLNGDNEL